MFFLKNVKKVPHAKIFLKKIGIFVKKFLQVSQVAKIFIIFLALLF